MDYWNILDEFVENGNLVIDRPKGHIHPKFPNTVYPVSYGFIENTTSMDKEGIDIFVGEDIIRKITGIICTADRLKKDSEIKILYGCSSSEIENVMDFLNRTEMMKAIFVSRQ